MNKKLPKVDILIKVRLSKDHSAFCEVKHLECNTEKVLLNEVFGSQTKQFLTMLGEIKP